MYRWEINWDYTNFGTKDDCYIDENGPFVLFKDVESLNKKFKELETKFQIYEKHILDHDKYAEPDCIEVMGNIEIDLEKLKLNKQERFPGDITIMTIDPGGKRV